MTGSPRDHTRTQVVALLVSAPSMEVMEMLRAFRSYFFGVDSYPVYEGVPREELWAEPKPWWTSEATDTSKPMLSTESLSESLASWFGVVLPKRVSVVQDLDDTTIFALEIFKVIPPSWIAILAVLGVIFLLYLGCGDIEVRCDPGFAPFEATLSSAISLFIARLIPLEETPLNCLLKSPQCWLLWLLIIAVWLLRAPRIV